jgi:hypothetical protein
MAGRRLNHRKLAAALAHMTDLPHGAAARQLGVSAAVVALLRRDYGLASPGAPQLTEAQQRRRVELAVALEAMPGISHREAGRRLNAHWTTIRSVREAHGLRGPGVPGQQGPRRQPLPGYGDRGE